MTNDGAWQKIHLAGNRVIDWDPANGGLPERPASCLAWKDGCLIACTPGNRRCETGAFPWPSPTAGASCGTSAVPWLGTITPPTADPLSPFQRAELERILLDLDVARERLRKLLERA